MPADRGFRPGGPCSMQFWPPAIANGGAAGCSGRGSWFGTRKNTFARPLGGCAILWALAMGNFTRFPTLARDHNTLMQCSIFLLHRNKNPRHITLGTEVGWALPLTPVDGDVFPWLLNKWRLSTLWPARTPPLRSGPGRRGLLGRRQGKAHQSRPAGAGGERTGAFTWGRARPRFSPTSGWPLRGIFR